jgi:hypothetical protein
MKFVGFNLSVFAMALLTACGSSDDDQTELVSFDLDDYQAVSDSGNLQGIWVAVGNYSGTGSEDGFDYHFNRSQKAVFSIFSPDESDLYVTDCNGESLLINQDDEQLIIEGNLITDITNNNTITLQDQQEGFSWTAIKVNHNPSTIGSVAVEGSGNLSNIDEKLALGFCQQNEETLMSSGHSFYLSNIEISTANSLEESISVQGVSEIEYIHNKFQSPNLDGEFDVSFEYQGFVDGGFSSQYFYQGNGQGDSIELNVIHESQHDYQAEFFATALGGGQGAVFQVNLEY